MLEFQEKVKLKKYMYSKTVLVLFIILIILATNSVWKVYKKHSMTKDNLAAITTNLEELQAREKMLSSEIEKLKTVSGTEAEIREKYGLVKPGEEVITVVDSTTSTDSTKAVTSIGFWQRFTDWFR